MATDTPETRLRAAGITLPEPAAPIANYLSFVRAGALVTVSGQLPLRDGALLHPGRLGAEVTAEAGREAARQCMVNVLAQLRAACGGELRRVRRVVRLGGFVACAPEFTAHAMVMNGASDLAVAAFGEAGRHARSTVGVACLPQGAAVEIEGLFEVDLELDLKVGGTESAPSA